MQLTSRSLLRLAMRTWVKKVAAPSGVTTLLTGPRRIPRVNVLISFAWSRRMALRIEQESALYARVAVSLTQVSPISGITTLAVVVESLFDAAALGASPVC